MAAWAVPWKVGAVASALKVSSQESGSRGSIWTATLVAIWSGVARSFTDVDRNQFWNMLVVVKWKVYVRLNSLVRYRWFAKYLPFSER
jgi:hypothetical protein